MEVGKLYKIERMHWFVFPTKADTREGIFLLGMAPCSSSEINANATCFHVAHHIVGVRQLSQGSLFVLLEVIEEYKRILTPDGHVGWIFYQDEALWAENTFTEAK
jgi:hypothetical protein